MNEAITNLLTRRSVRAYTNEPVCRKDLETIVKAGYHAPSGRNLQTWHFTVVTNPDKLAALADAVGKALNRPGYGFYGCPALIIVTNVTGSSLPGADSACALTNMFNAAHALGLGTVWINQLNDCCNDPAVRAMLTSFGVPENHVAYGCAAVGHPAAGLPERTPKNPDVVSWVE